MTVSILFDQPRHRLATEAPEFFGDLNLDQVVEAVIAGRDGYDLAPLFSTPLDSVAAVRYRHEVFGDLDGTALAERVGEFAGRMRSMRARLAQAARLRYRYQKQRWFLNAAAMYCTAVSGLRDDLARSPLSSQGFRHLRDVLDAYVASEAFTALVADVERVQRALVEVHYCVHIDGLRVQASRYDHQPDYSAEVAATFAKFRQGAVTDYRLDLKDPADMNHVEARILDLVAELHPEVFADLERFCEVQRGYPDPVIGAFDREVQFYLAYLDHIDRLRRAGLRFCYPEISDRSKAVSVTGTFDLALASRLVADGASVVPNDISLAGPERVVVVTGPNQGGKTTLARTFGQLHHLAALGCPVPGTRAELFLCDRIFSHFEKQEDPAGLAGKLQDDLVRVRAVLDDATPASVVVLNEIFTSTTVDDALLLGRRILEQIIDLDLLCVYVTFVDELAALGHSVVSMVATVDPDDPAIRTYEVVRKPPDGLAYAAALAAKHRLTYQQLRERIAS